MANQYKIELPIETQSQIWSRNFIEYGQFIAKKFNDGRLTIPMLANCPAILECMHECYLAMIRYNMVDKLELQNENVKIELKNIALEYKDRLSIDDMVKMCKTLLCIEILLKD